MELFSLALAPQLMVDQKVRHLPVIDGGNIMGMLSIR